MTGKLNFSVGDSTTYFELSGNDFKLYVNGELRQTWTTILANDFLLLETGDFFLLEDGGLLIL